MLVEATRQGLVLISKMETGYSVILRLVDPVGSAFSDALIDVTLLTCAVSVCVRFTDLSDLWLRGEAKITPKKTQLQSLYLSSQGTQAQR